MLHVIYGHLIISTALAEPVNMAKETVQARGIRSRKAIERTEELLDIDLEECIMKKARKGSKGQV